MFDFDAGKLLIIGVVALIVIGPKELPRVLRQVGQAVGRLRRMATEFQGQFMEAMKEADLQDIKDELAKVGSHADLDVHFDPARDIQRELTSAVTPSAPVSQYVPATSGDGFALPPLPETKAIEDIQVSTFSSAGIAPEVPEAAEFDTAQGAGEAQKRKILLRKRRPPPLLPGVDPASRSGARFRNVRPRRQEVSDQ